MGIVPSKTRAVANFFIRKGLDSGNPITLMQLMKLVYFSHGWSLAIRNVGMIPDPIEAWRFGPVIQSLYRTARTFGGGPIAHEISDHNEPSPLTTEDLKILNFVWETYGQLHAFQMSSVTHEHDSPWYKAWITGGFRIQNFPIPNDEIQRYFKIQLNKFEGKLN